MHTCILRILLLAAMVGLLGGAPVMCLSKSDDVAAILAATRARLDASSVGDTQTYAKFLTSTATLIDDDGSVLTRELLIKHQKPHLYPFKATLENARVAVSGSVAILRGTEKVQERYSQDTIVTRYAITNVFVKREGTWLLDSVQLTTIAEDHRTLPMASPKNLAQFAGTYQWSPKMLEVLTVQNGRLHSSLDPHSLLYFVGPLTLTEKGDLALTTFYRNASGHIAGFVYEMSNGQHIHAVRIK